MQLSLRVAMFDNGNDVCVEILDSTIKIRHIGVCESKKFSNSIHKNEWFNTEWMVTKKV